MGDGDTTMKSFHNCGYEYDSGYIIRVVNLKDDTLFVSPCFYCCLEFIRKGGLMLQGYRLEVMKYEG